MHAWNEKEIIPNPWCLTLYLHMNGISHQHKPFIDIIVLHAYIEASSIQSISCMCRHYCVSNASAKICVSGVSSSSRPLSPSLAFSFSVSLCAVYLHLSLYTHTDTHTIYLCLLIQGGLVQSSQNIHGKSKLLQNTWRTIPFSQKDIQAWQNQ